ncbi:MAG: allantoate amidohydrolase [Leptospirales bacterium]|nr:allantoate amidohydrolase [Leptospirales bacterium]
MQSILEDVLKYCDVLATHTEQPGLIRRTFLSEPMKQTHASVSSWMKEAGMTVRVDNAGNIIGRLESKNPNAKILMTGSHLDSVPDAGKYDGILGVMLGIGIAKALKGTPLNFHFDVIGFSDEEGVRYSMPYIGSLGIAGRLGPEMLARVDANGISMKDAIKNFGLNSDAMDQVPYDFSKVLGFFEMHIEQGPVLESENLEVGIVTGLVGQSRVKLAFHGMAGHAGTVPMTHRKDAFMGVAQLAEFMEPYARSVEGLVATIGMIELKPNGSNVVPGEAFFSLDIRHGDQTVLDQATERILARASEIAAERGLKLEIRTREKQAVVRCDPGLTDAMAATVEASGYKPRRLVSGAGHDTATLSHVTPTTMLFIRSPGGISHNPIESVIPEDVGAALKIGIAFLKRMNDKL